MKRLFLLTAILATAAICRTQPVVQNPFPKTITVEGSAVMEIIPDEIYVNIELQEYQKKGNHKKDLETLKSQFLESCKTVGIADSLVTIASYSGLNNYYGWKKNKKKDLELFASVTYQVKFKSSKLMDDLVEKLDDEATQNFQVVSTSHSKMTEFRKQLKIQAIKAARDKGIYLTEAINEKLGEAITINEPDLRPFGGGFYMDNSRISNNEYTQFNTNFRDENNDNAADNQELDFNKLTLRYEVTVVFAIR